MTTRLPALLLVASALASGAGVARAAEVQLNPVVVSLSPSARSALVSVRNAGTGTARFEIQARSWGESPAGEMILGATEDVAVYPPVLTLGPGEERNLRIGAVVPTGPVEKTYRVFLQEMAPPEKPDGAVQIRVVSRIGIPVFVAPVKAVESARVADLRARARKVSFRIVNEGTVHVRPVTVKVIARGADGKALFEQDLPAWYVLAGGERAYEASLPDAACSGVAAIEVVAALDRGALQSRLEKPSPCAP